MKIPEELWQEIIAETRTRLADWEAQLVAEGREDRFVVRVEQLSSSIEAIITEKKPRMYGPAHVVIRDRLTGEMHRATRKQAGKGRFKISWKSTDPKFWARLADEPASTWVRELKLTDFVVILGANMTGVRSSGLIISGRSFNVEQTQEIQAYAREHRIDTLEAVERLHGPKPAA